MVSAVASKRVIDKLVAAGVTDGPAYPIYQDRGEVILVKHGNPKNIHTVRDLGHKGVRLVMPNFKLEPGAFNTYAEAIYNIAARDPHPPKSSSMYCSMARAMINRNGSKARASIIATNLGRLPTARQTPL